MKMFKLKRTNDNEISTTLHPSPRMIKLYEFPHSHYCEKVRWVLDYKGLNWQARPINPGEHLIRFQRKFGAASLPIINDNGFWLQGSQAICLYLEQQYPQLSLLPNNEQLRQTCLQACSEHDQMIGDPLRRVLYSMLAPWPGAVQYYFTHRSGLIRTTAFRLTRQYILGKIHDAFVGNQERVDAARTNLDKAIQQLSKRLSSQPFLVGDSLTLADINLASMFSILVQPHQHPLPWPDNLPEIITRYRNQFLATSVGQRVLDTYARHRPPTQVTAYQRAARLPADNLFG